MVRDILITLEIAAVATVLVAAAIGLLAGVGVLHSDQLGELLRRIGLGMAILTVASIGVVLFTTPRQDG